MTYAAVLPIRSTAAASSTVRKSGGESSVVIALAVISVTSRMMAGLVCGESPESHPETCTTGMRAGGATLCPEIANIAGDHTRQANTIER